MKYIKLFEQYIKDSSSPQICMYYDYGVRQDTASVWSNFFREQFRLEPHALTKEEFYYSNFKDYDLIIIPGGVGWKENLGISEDAKEGLKKYVKEGGKILGVCAGAILISECYEWSLGLIPLTHDEEKHLHVINETFFLNFKVTTKGKEVFNTENDLINLYFHQGPIMKKTGDCEVLIEFQEEPPHDKDITDFAKGKIAGGMNKYGNGFVIAISPHIEKTEMHKHYLYHTIKYLLSL